jgi:hypothetical protein
MCPPRDHQRAAFGDGPELRRLAAQDLRLERDDAGRRARRGLRNIGMNGNLRGPGALLQRGRGLGFDDFDCAGLVGDPAGQERAAHAPRTDEKNAPGAHSGSQKSEAGNRNTKLPASDF